MAAGHSHRCQVSGVRCQDYESDDVENYQILQVVICLLTPDTRNLYKQLLEVVGGDTNALDGIPALRRFDHHIDRGHI